MKRILTIFLAFMLFALPVEARRFGTIDALGNVTVKNGKILQVNSTGDDKNVQITHDDTDTKITGSVGDMKLEVQDGNEVIVAGLPIKIISAVDTDGLRNIFIGVGAGDANTEGDELVFIGDNAGNDNNTGDFNVFIGTNAGAVNTSGNRNFFLGNVAGEANTTASDNVFIGDAAGRNSNAADNIFIGKSSGTANISGTKNVFIGNASGFDLQSGQRNVLLGTSAGINLLNSRNVMIGNNVGQNATTADNNVYIGRQAGNDNVDGDGNVFIGDLAGKGVVGNSNSSNVFVGLQSGFGVTTGGTNTAIGYRAGEDISSGTGNVCLGHMSCEGNLTTQSNQLYIDNSNTATPLIYGDMSKDSGAFVKFQPNNIEVLGVYANDSTVRINGILRTGDGGTTNYAQFAADGELTLFGTARIKKQIPIDNANLGKGNTAPTQVIIGNYNSWEYGINDDTVFTFHLPHEWATGTDVTINIDWYINEAGGDEIKWRIDWAATPHTSSEPIDGPTHTGNSDTGDIVVPSTVKFLTSNSLTISGGSLSVGDQIGVKISRIAITNGTDPSNEPAIIDLHIEYIANKLGEAT